MRVCLLPHHGKEAAIAEALWRNDFQFCDPYSFDYEAVLVDSDHPYAVPVPEKHNILKECARRGIPIILYPHGAPPDLDFDGLRRPSLPLSLQLLPGEGHAEIFRRIGVKHRFEVVGYTMGELTPRDTAVVPPRSILFAPIHPWADGVGILDMHKGANTAAYHEFLNHPAPVKMVRMYGADAPNGVYERRPDVTYQQSDLGNGIEVIDQHDAVISYGTLAYNALARGKPTAFIYAFPAHKSDDGKLDARKFESYREFCAYPASLGMGDLDDLFSRDVSEWKRLFLGGPLDEERLVSLIRGFRANRAQRRKLARMR